ncbi:hypothetical protein OH77DRAFT_1421437 [Trametes cingulata]|nr:hypothetical protein OH77DRAFT_1421437 [Trametes cingulata]
MGLGRRTGASRELDIASRFLSDLRIPEHDRSRIAALLKDMGIETQKYLLLFATVEARDSWLEELRSKKDLTPIQVGVLKEGLDRSRWDAR